MINTIYAGTRYGDCKGNVAIDRSDKNAGIISALAKYMGIDTKRYFPIALNARYTAISTPVSELKLRLVLYTVETSIASNYEELEKANNPIRVTPFMKDIGVEKFLRDYTKQFEFCVASKGKLNELVFGREFDIAEPISKEDSNDDK